MYAGLKGFDSCSGVDSSNRLFIILREQELTEGRGAQLNHTNFEGL